MGKCIKCGKKAGFLKSECDSCKKERKKNIWFEQWKKERKLKSDKELKRNQKEFDDKLYLILRERWLATISEEASKTKTDEGYSQVDAEYLALRRLVDYLLELPESEEDNKKSGIKVLTDMLSKEYSQHYDDITSYIKFKIEKPIIAKFFGYHPNDNKYGIAIEVTTDTKSDTMFLYDWLLFELPRTLSKGDYVTFDELGHDDGKGLGKNVKLVDMKKQAGYYKISAEEGKKIWDENYDKAFKNTMKIAKTKDGKHFK